MKYFKQSQNQSEREYKEDIASVYDILKTGSDKARQVAAKTLDEVRTAIGLEYFK